MRKLLVGVPFILIGCADDAAQPRPVDPCVANTYNATQCSNAVAARGFFWYGVWYPRVYSQPALYYDGSYRAYVARGGTTRPVIGGANVYSRSYVAPHASTGTSRGGFGSIGAGHGSFGG